MSHQGNVRLLYKTILRLHRALPTEVRELGDQYVKDEFRRHKNAGQEHIGPFMIEWSEYCTTLAKQLGIRGPKTGSGVLGQSLPEKKLDDFEGQQVYQLYELRKSIAPVPGDVEEAEKVSSDKR